MVGILEACPIAEGTFFLKPCVPLAEEARQQELFEGHGRELLLGARS